MLYQLTKARNIVYLETFYIIQKQNEGFTILFVQKQIFHTQQVLLTITRYIVNTNKMLCHLVFATCTKLTYSTHKKSIKAGSEKNTLMFLLLLHYKHVKYHVLRNDITCTFTGKPT